MSTPRRPLRRHQSEALCGWQGRQAVSWAPRDLPLGAKRGTTFDTVAPASGMEAGREYNGL